MVVCASAGPTASRTTVAANAASGGELLTRFANARCISRPFRVHPCAVRDRMPRSDGARLCRLSQVSTVVARSIAHRSVPALRWALSSSKSAESARFRLLVVSSRAMPLRTGTHPATTARRRTTPPISRRLESNGASRTGTDSQMRRCECRASRGPGIDHQDGLVHGSRSKAPGEASSRNNEETSGPPTQPRKQRDVMPTSRQAGGAREPGPSTSASHACQSACASTLPAAVRSGSSWTLEAMSGGPWTWHGAQRWRSSASSWR